jgi:hypothetical protein
MCPNAAMWAKLFHNKLNAFSLPLTIHQNKVSPLLHEAAYAYKSVINLNRGTNIFITPQAIR